MIEFMNKIALFKLKVYQLLMLASMITFLIILKSRRASSVQIPRINEEEKSLNENV